MDYKYIEQLLDRYFEAETTLKEEQILKAFFEQSEEELPESLRQYKPLFAAMEQDETLGDDFRIRPLMRAAAVVAILLTLSTALNQSFKEDKVWADESDYALRYEPTGNEPAMAYDQVNTDSVKSDSLYKPSGYFE